MTKLKQTYSCTQTRSWKYITSADKFDISTDRNKLTDETN